MDQLQQWRVDARGDQGKDSQSEDKRCGDGLLLFEGKRQEEEDVESTSKDEEDGEVIGVWQAKLESVLVLEEEAGLNGKLLRKGVKEGVVGILVEGQE